MGGGNSKDTMTFEQGMHELDILMNKLVNELRTSPVRETAKVTLDKLIQRTERTLRKWNTRKMANEIMYNNGAAEPTRPLMYNNVSGDNVSENSSVSDGVVYPNASIPPIQRTLSSHRYNPYPHPMHGTHQPHTRRQHLTHGSSAHPTGHTPGPRHSSVPPNKVPY